MALERTGGVLERLCAEEEGKLTIGTESLAAWRDRHVLEDWPSSAQCERLVLEPP